MILPTNAVASTCIVHIPLTARVVTESFFIVVDPTASFVDVKSKHFYTVALQSPLISRVHPSFVLASGHTGLIYVQRSGMQASDFLDGQ